MSVVADYLDPAVGDGSGYRVRERDLRFLNIDELAIDMWRAQRAPLGVTARQYRALCDELAEALLADGVPVERCDIRIKGSAAEFFSGHHKVMPRARDDIVDLFRELRKRVPREWEIEEIEDRLFNAWLTDGEFPHRRPFDSMVRLGLSREPSDIDLQISSDAILHRCKQALRELGQDPTTLRLNHQVYNFVRRDLIDHVLPGVYLLSLRLTDSFGRGVNIAVFPTEGPPDVSETHGPLSSHFREDDWIVMFSSSTAGGEPGEP